MALCGHCGHIHAGYGAANAACTSCGEGEPVPAFCPESLTSSANRTVLSRDSAPSATPAKRSSSSRRGRPACSAWCSAKPSPPATTTMPAAKRNQRRTVNPRRPEGHRLLGQRAGRRPPRRLLLRPHLAEQRPHRGRPSGDGARRHRLSDLPPKVARWWRDAEGGNFDAQRFIPEFIAPDRQWLGEFRGCRSKAALPPKGWQGWNAWWRTGWLGRHSPNSATAPPLAARSAPEPWSSAWMGPRSAKLRGGLSPAARALRALPRTTAAIR